MTDLLTRLEQATEGSRELDTKIFKSASGLPVSKKNPELIGPDDGWNHGSWAGRALRYTTSLDAALTLVDPEWRWDVRGVFNQQQTKRVGFVRIITGEPGSAREFECEASTPALALCIAALRARG